MTTPAVAAVRKRVVHNLETPFSTVTWPEISPEDQDTILELLCDLLSPVGHHRRTHNKGSKGKRTARRKGLKAADRSSASEAISLRPAEPGVINHIIVGFNAISRYIASLSNIEESHTKDSGEQPCSMVFVARGNQSAAFNCHFPRMVGFASRKGGRGENIKLVGFSKPCSERLAACLGIARVSSLAIKGDAPGAQVLWKFVNDHVAPIDIAWLSSLGSVCYKPTKIAAVHTTVGPRRTKAAKTQ